MRALGAGIGLTRPLVLPARPGMDDIDSALSMLGIAGDRQPPLGGAVPVVIWRALALCV